MNATHRLRWMLKPAVFLACLVPIAWLAWDAWTGNLGANPINELLRRIGIWVLRFLLLTLAITPARRLLGWGWLARFRRMLGLFAFTYVCLHFLVYLVLDQFFDWPAIVEDVAKRPYITVGFTAFMLLLPLAVTSTKKMIKRLGKRWVQLHRLAYVIAALGIIHFLWLVKSDISRPLTYGMVLTLLLGLRAWYAWAPAPWTGSVAQLGTRLGGLLRSRPNVNKIKTG